MKGKNLSVTIVIGMVFITLMVSVILLSGCSAKSAPEDGSEKGLSIIDEYENVKVSFESRKNVGDGLVPEEIKGRDVYYYTEDTLASPREYFFLEETGKVYLLKEGCWFCVNEDYKNVTPGDMYEAAEQFRNILKAESKKK